MREDRRGEKNVPGEFHPMSGKQDTELTLGGMAVIEGVMIKGSKHAVVTVRDEDGVLKTGRRRLRKRSRKFFRWPVVRGLLVFGQTLTLGYWALDFSATEAIGEEEGSPWMMALTMALAFALGIALFFYLPLLLTQLAREQLVLIILYLMILSAVRRPDRD